MTLILTPSKFLWISAGLIFFRFFPPNVLLGLQHFLSHGHGLPALLHPLPRIISFSLHSHLANLVAPLLKVLQIRKQEAIEHTAENGIDFNARHLLLQIQGGISGCSQASRCLRKTPPLFCKLSQELQYFLFNLSSPPLERTCKKILLCSSAEQTSSTTALPTVGWRQN